MMKFSTRQDTDVPAEALFKAVSDFDKLERILLRRGAEVRREDRGGPVGIGSAWQILFDWRGRPRDLALKLTGYQPPEHLIFAGQSPQFNVGIEITVVALTRTKSRLITEIDMQPRGMKARLLLQTAKLAKSQLDRKFAQRVEDFVGRIAVSQ